MSDDVYHDDYDEAGDAGGRTRPGPTSYALVGLLVGLVVGFGIAWAVGGNPFSDTNEVVYTEVVVNSVSPEEDQLCWADEPERRDSPVTCAILALDPELTVPAPGDRVVIGLVDFDTPDGDDFRQVVHVAQAPAREVDDEPDADEDAPGDEPEDTTSG